MATNDRQAREERARLRTYQARQEVHAGKQRRRIRDNVIASIALVVVLALAAGAQLFYFTGGPGAPERRRRHPRRRPPRGREPGDVPSADLAEGRTWTGTLDLNDIPLGIELDGAAAPQAVAQRRSASSRTGFYDGQDLPPPHASDSIWVLQCGDPDGDGTGGPGYSYGPVENAPADGVYPAGTIAMARQPQNAVQPGQPVLHRLRRHDAARPTRPAATPSSGRSRAASTSCTPGITDAGPTDGGIRRRTERAGDHHVVHARVDDRTALRRCNRLDAITAASRGIRPTTG